MGGMADARWRVLTALALMAICVAVLPTGAEAFYTPAEASAAERGAIAAKRKAARLRVLTTSQRKILRRGFVRVRIRARKGTGVRVFAAASRGKRRGRSITRRRLIRMRRGGKRVVLLRLNRVGRRVVKACGVNRVRAAGRARPLGARKSRKLRQPRRVLRRGPRRCSGSARGLVTGGKGLDAPPRNPRPLGPIETANADRCDFLDPALCLYPWPNNQFTREDGATPTKRRLDLNVNSVPKNRFGKPIDPTDQNRADGFSPGNMIVTRVPGFDTQPAFDRTGAVPITDMGRTYAPAQAVVVINARTHERHLIWAEIDSNPEDPSDVTLIVRPGTNFEEGERYIVALRNLKSADGSPLAPREEFRAYRDALTTKSPAIERRRAGYERIFDDLALAGIRRSNLYLAWDFTVASRQSLTDRALAIRDDAFNRLGDPNLADFQVQGSSPQFIQNPDINDDARDGAEALFAALPDQIPNPVDFNTIDGYREFTPEENPTTARRITGQMVVPCYLDQLDCPPGSKFALGADGKPRRVPGNTTLANVICTVPQAAVQGADPPLARPSLYGHGLLGSAGEVLGGSAQPFGQDQNFTFCATDWAGMSFSDVPNVITLLQDLSRFDTLVDRIQQGYVNFMYVGRWMIHPQGASANPDFQVAGRSVIDTRRLFYDGNSQGGILSGGLTALSPDVERSVHGVPGMNYSTLLRRSVDFDTYANGDISGFNVPAGLYQNYPNELERPLILSLIQLLWDRGESNGYAHHMTDDPLPGSPRHQVLLHPAFGDHQVANVAAEVEARTIGASAHRPALYRGRSPDVEPLFGIPTAPLSGFTGSAIVYWDGGPPGRVVEGKERGSPAPPTGNVPPREGKDPHGFPRATPAGWKQKSEFLRIGGTLFDSCGGGPCYSDGFTGP